VSDRRIPTPDRAYGLGPPKVKGWGEGKARPAPPCHRCNHVAWFQCDAPGGVIDKGAFQVPRPCGRWMCGDCRVPMGDKDSCHPCYQQAAEVKT